MMSWSGIDFQANATTLCILVILLVIALKIITSVKRCNDSKEESVFHSNTVFAGRCKFPDCVRCRRQKDVLLRARTRLTYYDDGNNHNEGVESMSSQLLKDIQTSYQKLVRDGTGEDSGSFDLSTQNPLGFHMKGIRAKPIWDTDDFPGVHALSNNLDEIRKEFRDLLEKEADGNNLNSGYWKVNDTPSGKWRICHLLDQGVQTKAAGVCPVTWQTVSSMPAVMTDCLFGNVAFSVIDPGTTIAPHFGPTNIRIRCHLGLQTPSGCQLTVGDQSLQWAKGEITCFDETFLHGVQMTGTPTSGEVRVVLIVDLWHPDLDKEKRNLISYAFSSASVS